ncbi:MAG TPA: D-alanyl-D-alanine carboxypeptidase family protein [Thermoleophilaceae bacterium]|jgi:D-alanyl-D-alanine carboxypeptidase (penicillin-binding protein 5/6)
MGACVAVAFALAVFALPAGAATSPELDSTAAIVIDAKTGAVLFSQHGTSRRAIASTTKLMTANLTLEKARPSEVFTAPAYHAGPAESVIGLRKGEEMTVHDLLRALLLPSANDAAWDLAYNVGDGSVRRFVRMMNRQAKQLGLTHTHYANPIGLDDPGNYSTAGDLAKLASIDMRNPKFARIVDLTHATLKTGSHERTVINRNDLVGRYHYVDGVKTGHTIDAGYVLVGAAHRQGASVISVVLGEPSIARRDADSIALLRYGLAQYHRVGVLKGGKTIASVPIHQHGGQADLAAARPVSLTVRRGTPVRTRIEQPEELKGPLPAGRAVGRVQVLVNGNVVRTVPLVTVDKVPGPEFMRRLEGALRDVLITLAVLFVLLAGTLVALRVRVVRRQRARSVR